MIIILLVVIIDESIVVIIFLNMVNFSFDFLLIDLI